MVMMKHFFSAKREVEIDDCPSCGGVLLDKGELAAIRKRFRTEREREGAFNKLYAEKFGCQLVAQTAEARSEVRRNAVITALVFGVHRDLKGVHWTEKL